MSVTIKDLAQRLGLSCATVSMALNNRPGVNAQTRGRVLDLAQSLGYEGGTAKRESPAKRMISFLVYKKHGRVVSDTHFFSELIESVEHTARAEGYQITLVYCRSGQEAETLRGIRASSAEGLLILGTEMMGQDLLRFGDWGLPAVLLDCDLDGCGADRVLIDNFGGMRAAVDYLYSRGCNRIGYLHSALSIRNFDQRAEGFRLALREAAEQAPVYPLGPNIDEACADMSALLAGGTVLPPALVADNDLIAFGAVKAMKKFGLRVPEDVCVVGFDDVPLCTWMEPGLTSVRVPRGELGGMAVERLAARIRDPEAPLVKIEVGTALTVRESVCTRTE